MLRLHQSLQLSHQEDWPCSHCPWKERVVTVTVIKSPLLLPWGMGTTVIAPCGIFLINFLIDYIQKSVQLV